MAEDSPSTVSQLNCPECGQSLGSVSLEKHLRRQHQVYQFRGHRRSYNDLLVILFKLVCRARSDVRAWEMLAEIAEENHGAKADTFLAASFGALLSRFSAEEEKSILPEMASTISRQPLRPGMVLTFAQSDDPRSRHLALLLLGFQPSASVASDLRLWQQLLEDRALPSRSRLASLSSLLREKELTDHQIQSLAHSLIKGRKGARGLTLLRRLENLTGPLPTLASIKTRLKNQIQIRCPRCETELPRAEMIDHLWHSHRLLLEGQQVRDPWKLMDRWIQEEKRPSSGLLNRCRRLAANLDGEKGLMRLQRMLLARGVASNDARQSLEAEALEKKATLCAECYAMVPIPQPEVAEPLNYYRGRISGNGYRLELKEGLTSRLEMETPTDGVYRGPGPGSTLTVQGATLLIVGPIVLFALLIALGIVQIGGRPLLTVGILLFIALFSFLGVWSAWRPKIGLQHRVVDLTWTRLVPRLLLDGFSLEHSRFLARLSLSSLDHGQPSLRGQPLSEWIPVLEKNVRAHAEVASHLAALQRLRVNDALATFQDAVALVARELGRCFQGRLPFAFAEALLYGWKTDWWTKANLARLKILVCDYAFEAGYEVRYLQELSQSYPALGAVLEIDEPEHLAQLRLLWSLRPSRPWDSLGRATTILDHAEEPDSTVILDRHPDLLLLWTDMRYGVSYLSGKGDPQNDGPLELLVTSRGLVVQGALFTEIPPGFQTSSRKLAFKSGYEVLIGKKKFRFMEEPSEAIRNIEKWLRYVIRDLLRRTDEVFAWKSPDLAAQLRSRGAMLCPECHKPILPRLGKVARTVESS